MIDSIATLSLEQLPELYRYVAEHPEHTERCVEDVYTHHRILKGTIRDGLRQAAQELKRAQRAAAAAEKSQRESQREAEKAQREAQREAEKAQREAQREAEKAEREAQREAEKAQAQKGKEADQREQMFSGLPRVLVEFFEAFERKQASATELQHFVTTCATDAGSTALREQGHEIETLDDLALEKCAQAYAYLTKTPIKEARTTFKRRIEAEAKAAALREIQDRLAKEPEWMRKLDRNAYGQPVSNITNATLYLLSHTDIGGTLAHNEFTNTTLWRVPPTLEEDFADAKVIEAMSPVTDDEVSLVQLWLAKRGQSHEHSTVQRLVDVTAKTKRFHPVRDYLHSVQWDGKPRVLNYLHTYMGAPDDEYTRFVSRVWLVGAVARIMQPGCKLDTMIILESDQGKLKSTAIRKLHGDAFFTDQLSDLGSKDAHQDLLGRWCVEIAELDKLSKAEVSTAKRFLSILVDRYRPSYGRRTIESGRQCIFVGTVNPENDGTYLRDPSGNRRYLPVRTRVIDLEGIERDRDQLWAEACVMYADGVKWWATTEAETKLCEAAQTKRMTRDVWTDQVLNALNAGRHATITTSHVLENVLDVEPKDQTNYLQARVGSILRLAGWSPEESQAEGHLRYFQHPNAVFRDDLKITRAVVNTLKLPEETEAVTKAAEKLDIDLLLDGLGSDRHH